jgi:hypothetical protein
MIGSISSRRLTLGLVILFAVAWLPACSREKVEELAAKVGDKVKEQVKQAPPIAQDILPPSGSINLQMDRSLTIERANAELIPLGDNRAAFQIRSYSNKETEKLPAVFYHSITDAATVEGLVGRTLEGTLFAKLSENDVRASSTDSTVKLAIEAFEKNELRCRVLDGTLIHAAGSSSPVNGKIKAVIATK